MLAGRIHSIASGDAVNRRTLNMEYTTQQDAHGNVIVCKGSAPRNGYRVIFTGSYLDCMRVKVDALVNQEV
jgi:hypothetical protein